MNYNYGKADKNLIDHVRFYKKGDPTVAIHVRKDDVHILINIAFVCLSMIILMRCQEFFKVVLISIFKRSSLLCSGIAHAATDVCGAGSSSLCQEERPN